MPEQGLPDGRLIGHGPIHIDEIRQHLAQAGIGDVDILLAKAREQLAAGPNPDVWYAFFGDWMIFIGGF